MDLKLFYNRVAEMPIKAWVPLEDKFYRLVATGEHLFEFGDQLSQFHYCQAKNGGPIGKHTTNTSSTLT